MYEDPEENESEQPAEKASDPKQRAAEKTDEFRMHAELAAVFEGPRKFEAELIAGLDMDIARDVQKTMAKLAKSKSAAEIPVLLDEAIPDAERLLNLPKTNEKLSTNDYHV